MSPLHDGSPPPCKQCGGPQGWLFQTAFCKRDCDRAPQGAVKLTHKMNLGYGWVLWTENETPPFGWTHAIIIPSWPPQIPVQEWSSFVKTERPYWEANKQYLRFSAVLEGRPESGAFIPQLSGIAYRVP